MSSFELGAPGQNERSSATALFHPTRGLRGICKSMRRILRGSGLRRDHGVAAGQVGGGASRGTGATSRYFGTECANSRLVR
jgi:hypothetical protein